MRSRRERQGDARARFVSVALSFACALVLASCGDEVEYYQDGARRAQGRLPFAHEHRTLEGGLRELSTWTWWYPNGERRESGTYTDGKREGVWTQWYPNGQRRSRGNRAFDPATHSSPREGLWTFWHENGEILSRGLFVKGLREGHWDFSRVDGSIDAERTGEYHLDQRID